jgi:hypothetical protein
VDISYTMVAKLARRFLGTDAVVGDGVHDRLRETAAAYLAQR